MNGSRDVDPAPRGDTVWRETGAVRYYLSALRAAVPFADEQFTAMVGLIASGRRPLRRFLDLGSGDGILSAVLLGHDPDAQAVLVDFSGPMLEAAGARLGVAARLVFADLAAPSWQEAVAVAAPFDAVISGFAIHHLPDERKRALYGEILTLLAPGGTFAHIEHVAPEQDWVSEAFHAGMVDALHRHALRNDPTSSRAEIAAVYAARDDRDANILAPLDVQCGWLREVGFTEVVAPFRWYEIAVFGGRRPGS